MREIKVYTSLRCSYCAAAKQLLSSHGYQYVEINMQDDEALMIEIMQKSGQRTVPQIFVGEHSIGGYQELLAALTNNEFAQLLNVDD
ncbi:MAG: glutaredoxin domain-containing protein [Gammaproteobacteria bacterium]|nr:glutaredoxin domain-containing protein [Gammaproteobacteria bacterium]